MKTTRQIRHARMEDLPVILELIECGRQKMRESGNMDQWANGNPVTKIFENDIRLGNSYIMEEEGQPIATFAFVPGPDPTYLKIYEGKWLETESPYYVIHR
ncbi:MAG: N-acetyltransferase, partial [Bacteroidaceae bacterium]|nr:N-acetyltransferase [Bacteroidaceae bacterium]